MNFKRQTTEDPEVNLIPLIDVLLVILIFLMISTTYSKFTELKITLPTADAEKLQNHPQEIIVAVSSGGEYAVNKQVLPGRTVGALWHVPGGWAMREALGDTKAIVPSTKKVGGPGTRLDVPLTHVNASYVRSHFDAMEVGLSDGPRADEIALVLVMSCGPRVHNRVGGLEASAIKGEDGLR